MTWYKHPVLQDPEGKYIIVFPSVRRLDVQALSEAEVVEKILEFNQFFIELQGESEREEFMKARQAGFAILASELYEEITPLMVMIGMLGFARELEMHVGIMTDEELEQAKKEGTEIRKVEWWD